MYSESVLGTVVSHPGYLVVESGVSEKAPVEDNLIISQQDGVKLERDQDHQADVGEAGEDVEGQQDDEETFYNKIDGFVGQQNCH